MYMSRTHNTWCWCHITVWWQYLHCQWRNPPVRFHTQPLRLFCWTCDAENIKCVNTYTASDNTTQVRWRTRIAVFTCTPFPRIWYMRIHIWSRSLSLNAMVCDLLSRMGVFPVISWKVGVHRSGALCWWTWYRLLGSFWEVLLEYGFEVLVWSEQHTVYFLMYNCSAPVFKHINIGER